MQQNPYEFQQVIRVTKILTISKGINRGFTYMYHRWHYHRFIYITLADHYIILNEERVNLYKSTEHSNTRRTNPVRNKTNAKKNTCHHSNL